MADINLATLTNTQGFRIIGENGRDGSGGSVSGAGDINNDGYADVIIGAGGALSNTGNSYIIFGKAGGFSDINLNTTLSSSVGFRIIGENVGDLSGSSVSSAGDVNHDGYADIIIGAPSAISSAGKSYVIFGKANGFSDINLSSLSSTQGFRIFGKNANDYSGSSVSGAGDINKDGYADVIIGAYGAFSNGGESYVIFGKANGFSDINLSSLNSTQGFRIIAENINDFSGNAVSSAGDVNGDGYTDIIIGAFGALSHTGVSYVIFGKASGFSDIQLSTLSNTQGFRIKGENTNDQSGSSVSSAGDVNHDGYADIIIGAPYAISSAGKIYVIFGKASGFSDINLSSLSSTQGFNIIGQNTNDLSGWSVSSAGDVNSDGYADIIIGAYYALSQAGRSYVIFGKASGFSNIALYSSLSSTQGFKILGEKANDYSGISVSGAGDINNDGYADYIIGAYNGLLSNPGKSYVIFGNGAVAQSTTTAPTSTSTNTSATTSPTTVTTTSTASTTTDTPTITTTAPTSASVATSSTTHAITSTIMGGTTTDTINATTFTTANMNATSSTEKGALVASSASHLEPFWPLKLIALTISTTVEAVKQGIESTSDYLDMSNVLSTIGFNEFIPDTV